MEQIYAQDSINKEEQMKNELLARKSMKVASVVPNCEDKTNKKTNKTVNNHKESTIVEESKEQPQSKESQDKEQNDNKNSDNHSQP